MKWKSLIIIKHIFKYFNDIKKNGGKLINFSPDHIFKVISGAVKTNKNETLSILLRSDPNNKEVLDEWANIKYIRDKKNSWFIAHYIEFTTNEAGVKERMITALDYEITILGPVKKYEKTSKLQC